MIQTKKMSALLATLLLALVPMLLNAQPSEQVEMADTLYSNGKIYLVVLVLVTIFAGIIAFLLYMERKVNKLEKEINSIK